MELIPHEVFDYTCNYMEKNDVLNMRATSVKYYNVFTEKTLRKVIRYQNIKIISGYMLIRLTNSQFKYNVHDLLIEPYPVIRNAFKIQDNSLLLALIEYPYDINKKHIMNVHNILEFAFLYDDHEKIRILISPPINVTFIDLSNMLNSLHLLSKALLSRKYGIAGVLIEYFNFDMSELMEGIITRNDIEILPLIIHKYPHLLNDHARAKTYLNCACTHGRTGILLILIENIKIKFIKEHSTNLIEQAAKRGHLNILKILWPHCDYVSKERVLFDAVITNNRIEIINSLPYEPFNFSGYEWRALSYLIMNRILSDELLDILRGEPFNLRDF